jgi:hypothetical protein
MIDCKAGIMKKCADLHIIVVIIMFVHHMIAVWLMFKNKSSVGPWHLSRGIWDLTDQILGLDLLHQSTRDQEVQ